MTRSAWSVRSTCTTCSGHAWSDPWLPGGPARRLEDVSLPHFRPEYPAGLVARAAKVRLACFDVDGTLTDGRLWFDDAGRESKAFHVLDGQGLVQLRQAGITVALVTARDSLVAAARAGELGAAPHGSAKAKAACVERSRRRLGLEREQVASMGDDLPAVGVLRSAGPAAAPASVHHWTRGAAHWVTPSRGGEGAVRE